MNDKTEAQDDLEAESSEILTVTVRGRSQKYRFVDISSANMQDAINKMNATDAAKAADAKRLFQARIIAMGVRRVDSPAGKSERISVDEAATFPSALAKKLQITAMKFNGAGDDAEAEAKNE